jgi:hypothetical protein
MSIFDVRCARFKKQEDEAKDGEQVNYCKKTKFKQTSILLYIYRFIVKKNNKITISFSLEGAK